MNLSIKKFEELRLDQLYKILKLRFDVFVIEQNSIYDEFDNKDQRSTHFLIESEEGELIAYARTYLKSESTASLGRIVIHKNFRKTGLGHKIIQESISYIKSEVNVNQINISAQDYLTDFYSSFGFKPTSESYLDGGVAHIDMALSF